MPAANPFPLDSERAGIWEMLVPRDSAAFIAGDWGAVDADFDPERFEGLHAHASADPADWTIAYPAVDAYRDDWLRMSREFTRLPLARASHRDFLDRLTSLERIDIAGDRAVAHKRFRAAEPLADGGVQRVSLQTLYRLHRSGGRWRIVGFIGYLPLED
jgi:hypothetical protein